MTTTSRVSVDDTQWTELADGAAEVLVQRLDGTRHEVVVAAADPGAGATGIGHLLWSEQPFVAFSQLTASDKVFARSVENGGPLAVTKA